MRAGRLNHLVHVSDDKGTETVHWVEWLEQPPGSEVKGLRLDNDIIIRHRNLPPIEPGQWVAKDSRLLRVFWTGPSERVRHGFESHCVEYSGQSAKYTTDAGTEYPCRVFIERDVDYIGEVGRVAETRHRIEVLKHQLAGHEPASGDRVLVDGETFDIEGPAPGGNDGIVLQLVAL